MFQLLKSHLGPNSIALIASKKYYFGVGGGSFALQNLIAESDEMESTVVFKADDGKSNIREIIEVKKKKI